MCMIICPALMYSSVWITLAFKVGKVPRWPPSAGWSMASVDSGHCLNGDPQLHGDLHQWPLWTKSKSCSHPISRCSIGSHNDIRWGLWIHIDLHLSDSMNIADPYLTAGPLRNLVWFLLLDYNYTKSPNVFQLLNERGQIADKIGPP